MKYSVILSDFDYTLGDATDGIVQCVNAGLAALGLPPSDADKVRPTVGLSLEKTYSALTGDPDEERARRFSDAFIEEADRDMAHLTHLYEGTVPFLKMLRERDIRIGIVTTKHKRRITDIFSDHGVLEYLDLIVGGDCVTNVKPNPEGIIQALQFFNVSPEKVLFVGDTEVDAEAARSAGVDFIGVRTGSHFHEEFTNLPNIAILDDISAVGSYLSKM